jgi:bacillithiol biosynthesis cysteine-adding enzyme BshC
MVSLRFSSGPGPDPRYPLAGLYLGDYSRVAHLYDYSPHDSRAFPERARELAGHDFDRPGLAGLLEEYNRGLGAPPEALASARRLGKPGAVAIITGQQPGVLVGPLYTFWKAVSVIQLARAVEGLLPAGTPVVPVFWIGGEDHDLAEVARLTIQTPDGSLARLNYRPSAGTGALFPARASVGHLPAGPAAQALLDELEPLLGQTEFSPDVLAHLRRTAEASGSLSGWFGRLLLSLLGHLGLVLADPLLPGMRLLQRPALARMVTDNQAIGALFAEGQHQVRELGLDPQVEKDPDSANLYLYRGLERVPLRRAAGDGRSFTAGQGPEAEVLTESDLLGLASSPEGLSPNVVLRPLAQEWVFPVLAYVGGPGETSYFGLYKGLFHHFGRRLPVIYPRPNVTIVEPAVARHLSRCGLDAGEALDLDTLRGARARYLDDADPVGIDGLFARLSDQVTDLYAGADRELARLDPGLAALGVKNRDRVLAEVEWLRKKTWQQHRQNCQEAVRRYDALETALRPGGDFQERVFNLFPYLAKYGPGLTGEMASQPIVPGDATLSAGHRFLFI